MAPPWAYPVGLVVVAVLAGVCGWVSGVAARHARAQVRSDLADVVAEPPPASRTFTSSEGLRVRLPPWVDDDQAEAWCRAFLRIEPGRSTWVVSRRGRELLVTRRRARWHGPGDVL